jgi:hypothetical protein
LRPPAASPPFQSLADLVDETYFFTENYAFEGDTGEKVAG